MNSRQGQLLILPSNLSNPRGPRCYIQEFYDLAFHNVLIYRSIKYEDRVNVTFSYGRTQGPRFYIKELYVPALDLSQSPTTNSNKNNNNSINPCLFFDFSFVNIEDEHIVRYGDVNLTFSYGRNNAVANYVVRSFDQARLEVDYRREVVESRGVPWEDVVKAVSNGSTVVFRVDLAARPKFWKGIWYSKKKHVRIGACWIDF